MSGEFDPQTPELPELTELRAEVRGIYERLATGADTIARATGHTAIFDPTSERAEIKKYPSSHSYHSWNVYKQNGVWCLEEEVQRSSAESDAGSLIRETMTYPLASNDLCTRIIRKGDVKQSEGWKDYEEPSVSVGNLLDRAGWECVLSRFRSFMVVANTVVPEPRRKDAGGRMGGLLRSRRAS